MSLLANGIHINALKYYWTYNIRIPSCTAGGKSFNYLHQYNHLHDVPNFWSHHPSETVPDYHEMWNGIQFYRGDDVRNRRGCNPKSQCTGKIRHKNGSFWIRVIWKAYTEVTILCGFEPNSFCSSQSASIRSKSGGVSWDLQRVSHVWLCISNLWPDREWVRTDRWCSWNISNDVNEVICLRSSYVQIFLVLSPWNVINLTFS